MQQQPTQAQQTAISAARNAPTAATGISITVVQQPTQAQQNSSSAAHNATGIAGANVLDARPQMIEKKPTMFCGPVHECV